MSQPLQVHLEALSRYASTMDELSARFAETRAQLADADVAEDSFGLLPESRQAAAVYEERTTEGLGVLSSGEDVFGELAVAFRQMRDNYHGSDHGSAARLGRRR